MGRIYFVIILSIIYALLWSTKKIYHESLGVLILLALIVHLYLNRRWFLSLWKGKYSRKRTLMVISNLLILGFFTATLITGLMYSKALFPDLPIHEAARSFKKIHKFFAYGALIFLGTHTILHWPIISSYIRRLRTKFLPN